MDVSMLHNAQTGTDVFLQPGSLTLRKGGASSMMERFSGLHVRHVSSVWPGMFGRTLEP